MSEFEESSPTPASFVARVAGRPLLDDPHTTSGRCRRCRRKNAIRREVDRTDLVRDSTFTDGESVRLRARALPEPSSGKNEWEITAAFHRDHPHLPKEAVGSPERSQLQAVAALTTDGWEYSLDPEGDEYEYVEDALIVHDVSVEWFSPLGDGSNSSADRIDDRDSELVRLEPGDTRPDWPESDNEWRDRLVRTASSE